MQRILTLTLIIVLCLALPALALFCPKCGKKNADDSSFCIGCGQHIGDAEARASGDGNPGLELDGSDGNDSPHHYQGSGSPGSYPWTASRNVSAGDLAGLSRWELDVMRNEIYARHGHIFERNDLREYFSQQNWYSPGGDWNQRAAVNSRAEHSLTPVEQQNIQIIKNFQQGGGGGTAPQMPAVVVPATSSVGAFSWTASRQVTQQDLRGLSNWELDVMRNEIYARHGWIFNRSDLRKYFTAQSWYRPAGPLNARSRVNQAVEKTLTSLERTNIQRIQNFQKRGTF